MSGSQLGSMEREISDLIVSSLKLEGIEPANIDVKEALFDGGLGLDSIDALEIGVALRKRYGITIDPKVDDVKTHFRDISSLAAFIKTKVGK